MNKIRLLVFSFAFSIFCSQLPLAMTSTTHHVYLGEPIQKVINSAQPGDTIFIHTGIFYEHIVVNKSVSLVGESRDATIIDGNGTGAIVHKEFNDTAIILIVADNVSISNLTVRNGGFHGIGLNQTTNCTLNNIASKNSTSCISLINSNNNTIADSTFSNGRGGILLINSANNNITLNTTSENTNVGIATGGPEGSSNNLISRNTVTANLLYGMDIVGSENMILHNNISQNSEGVILDMAHDSQIYGNLIINNTSFGIHLIRASKNNTLAGNTIQNSGSCGLYIEYGKNNHIYHNNFIDNNPEAYSGDPASSGNIWDNGFEGNYWNDYQGEDKDADGIGDTEYTIYEHNKDSYPLMGMFYDFPVWEDSEHVHVISNSTVSDLDLVVWSNTSTQYLQPGQEFILFFTVGEHGITGFCRVMFPKDVLNSSSYIVLVDWQPVNFTELPISNSTHAYLYFIYTHSEHEVAVIREFTSFSILLLFTMVTLLLAIFYRRNRSPHISSYSKIHSISSLE